MSPCRPLSPSPWAPLVRRRKYRRMIYASSQMLHLTSLLLAHQPLPPVVAFAMGTLGGCSRMTSLVHLGIAAPCILRAFALHHRARPNCALQSAVACAAGFSDTVRCGRLRNALTRVLGASVKRHQYHADNVSLCRVPDAVRRG